MLCVCFTISRDLALLSIKQSKDKFAVSYMKECKPRMFKFRVQFGSTLILIT